MSVISKLFKEKVLGIEAGTPLNLRHLAIGGARLHAFGDALDEHDSRHGGGAPTRVVIEEPGVSNHRADFSYA